MIVGLTSLLFVSGATPDRFAKARLSGASIACIDLEDSVPEADKDAARAPAIAAVAEAPALAIRINPLATIAGLRDLLAIVDAGVTPSALLLPKAEHAAEIAILRGALGDAVPIVPLIESPAALAQTAAIAGAPGVAAMMFGGGDLAAELGVALAWEPLLAARGAFLLGCAAAGKPAIDVPWIALDDAAGLAEETRRAQAMGFHAKAAIHPAQVATIEAVMRPSPEVVAEARAALDAFAAAGGRAIRHQGRMLEAPIVRHYARIVAAADQSGANDA